MGSHQSYIYFIRYSYWMMSSVDQVIIAIFKNNDTCQIYLFTWPPPFAIQLLACSGFHKLHLIKVSRVPFINSQIHNMSNSVKPVNLAVSTKWLLNNHKGPFLVSIPSIKFLKWPKCTHTILLYSILIELSLILSVEARTSMVVTQTEVSEWKDQESLFLKLQ